MIKPQPAAVWTLVPTVDLFLPVPMFRESDHSPAAALNVFGTFQIAAGSTNPMYFGQALYPGITLGEMDAFENVR
jgi:hypothetical protein